MMSINLKSSLDVTGTAFFEMKQMKQNKSNATVGFKDQKIKLIHDVLLYYKFMQNNSNKVMAENPDQWVEEKFEDWLDKGRHPSNTSYTASQAGNTTTTSTAPVIVPATKKAEDEMPR